MEAKKGNIFDKKDVKKVPKSEAELKRDTTPLIDYYKAWDKFADAELQKEDDDDENNDGEIIPALNPKPEKERGPMSQAEMMQRTSGAKPNTKIVIKGGTVKKNSMADQLKQQGNAFFMSLEYEKAIDNYSRCLDQIPESDHTLNSIVYSNRAQCHIKLKNYEEAFYSADKALSHDGNHLKSIQRRGTAAYYTGRLRIARKDFMHSLTIDPS